MDWRSFDEREKTETYYQELLNFIDNEYKTTTCYPPFEQIFHACKLTPYDDVKVVILGQDPYHGEGQAMGLSFSVPDGIKPPPSLLNIYKELQNEYGYPIPTSGNLTSWAKQGVLLLNSVLSVRAHQPTSHAGKGWERYTSSILTELDQKDAPIVFMLWGNYARQKKALLHNPKHLVLEAPHPSPFSANNGFFGCDHFKKCNQFLTANGLSEIDWRIA